MEEAEAELFVQDWGGTLVNQQVKPTFCVWILISVTTAIPLFLELYLRLVLSLFFWSTIKQQGIDIKILEMFSGNISGNG